MTKELGAYFLVVRFALTKSGGGNPPDLNGVSLDKRTAEYVRSCMSFSPDFEDVGEIIKDYVFQDDGLSEIEVRGTSILGYPTPILRFELTEPMDGTTFLQGVWLSSYKLEIPNVNEDDPYYFEDHNGYSNIH
jgi:hypothetical protein